MGIFRQRPARVRLKWHALKALCGEVLMRRACLVILLLLPLVIVHAQDRTVLLAAHRAGRVEVLNPATLQSLGSIKVLPLADGVASAPGGFIFLREGLAPDFHGCCALYALDLKTRNMTKLLEPVSGVVVSPDGKHVITQRGNVGIESFDARSLQREPGIARSIAPGVYGLRFSPDGRLLFGASNFPAPTLDIFDFNERKLLRRFNLPQGTTIVGTWIGNDFYLYGHRKASGQLWRVKSDSFALERPVKINFSHPAQECELLRDEAVLGASGRLFLYEVFGMKGDRRVGCATTVPGGVFSIDPQTGGILAHLASDLHFAWLISGTDGKELYGVDVRDTNWTSVVLVRLDAATGETLARRDLVSDVWFITLATIPTEVLPLGQVEAATK